MEGPKKTAKLHNTNLCQHEHAQISTISEHFGPLRAGDRQRQIHMAKHAIRCKGALWKSVCRELLRVALAAELGRMYRLRIEEWSRAGVPI
jgi:hypothetical protein